LFQNTPNPFSTNTEISFSIPDASIVSLIVYDVQGRELYTKESYYDKGRQSIVLNSEVLNSTGLMFYTIKTAFGSATKSLIQIK